MRHASKFAIASVLAVSLTLGACATNPTTGQTQIDPATITQIQQNVALACGFVPTITTIVNIVTTFLPGSASAAAAATQAAAAICAAVTPPKASLRRAAGRPMVNGVVVEGHFAR